MKNELGILILTSCFVSAVHGQVTVTSSDFVDSEYTYSTPFSPFNLTLFSDAHNALIETQSGTFLNSEGSGTQFVRPLISGASSFTYRFDFTEILPSKVSITDKLIVFNNNAINSSIIDLSYSINGTDFSAIRSLDASNIPSGQALLESNETYTLDFSQEVSSFFYRVDFDSNAGGDPNQNQFGHSFANGDIPFSATFTTVPEPSSLALSGLALISALARRKRQ